MLHHSGLFVCLIIALITVPSHEQTVEENLPKILDKITEATQQYSILANNENNPPQGLFNNHDNILGAISDLKSLIPQLPSYSEAIPALGPNIDHFNRASESMSDALDQNYLTMKYQLSRYESDQTLSRALDVIGNELIELCYMIRDGTIPFNEKISGWTMLVNDPLYSNLIVALRMLLGSYESVATLMCKLRDHRFQEISSNRKFIDNVLTSLRDEADNAFNNSQLNPIAERITKISQCSLN